jgi:hypothetical protein
MIFSSADAGGVASSSAATHANVAAKPLQSETFHGDPGIVGIAPGRSLNLSIVRSIVAGPTPGERMPVAPLDYFDAGFPGASQTVRITSLHDAKVFARRWVIRDKDPALKALLRHMEKANSSATADIAIRQLKQALACRGMLVDATALHSDH